MTEPPVKNGVQRKREKSSVVKKDWVPPPPKIFISSVVKDQQQKRPPDPLQAVDDRPWDSEDSSVGSSPSTTDNRPPSHPLGLNKNSSSPLSSPQPSLVDSAMDFPESWAGAPSELPQSHSNDSLRDSTSAGDLTSLGSPLESEKGLQDQVDSELLVDEGNFSLSLEGRSALLSEEEDAYRYILDLKEEEFVSGAPDKEITNNSNAKEPCPDMTADEPTSPDPFYRDGDSGYYPDQKDVSTTQPDDVSSSLLSTDPNDPIAVVKKELENLSKNDQESLASSNTEAVQKVSTESDQANYFEDDQEWPVVQYERISISGSEEDIEELGAGVREEPFDEEMEENQVPDVFSGRMKDGTTEENRSFKKTEGVDQVQEPEQDGPKPEDKTDQISTVFELPQISASSQPGVTDTVAEIQEKEEQTSGTTDSSRTKKPTTGDLCESYQQVTDRLVETNFNVVKEEKPESSPKKIGDNFSGDEETTQQVLSLVQENVATKSLLEDEPNATQSLPQTKIIPENGTIEDKCEDRSMKENKFSSGLQNVSDDKGTEDALTENKMPMPVSATSQSNVFVSDVHIPEASDEPNPGHEIDEQSFRPPTPTAVDQPYDDENEGQATWEETKIVDAERAERCRAELRLSLSVTPLQPAPSQPVLTDSDSAQEKVITVRN